MKAIDYPADFDNVVTAALARPCFIDSRGNLYVLRDDGATELVAGPETGSNVQFQGAGSNRQLAWTATQERLFVSFNEGAKHVHATLPHVRDSIKLPSYRRSVLVAVSSSSAYLVHNTPDALYCFAVAPESVSLLAKVERHNGRGAWVEGGNLYVFGMRTRIHKTGKHWLGKGEWFSLKYGIGTLLRIDLSSRRVHIDSAADTTKALVAEWMAQVENCQSGHVWPDRYIRTPMLEDQHVKPLLEAWLDSIETEHGRVLIGAVADKRQPESDLTFEEPHPLDFEGIAFYRWRDGKVELLHLMRGVRYVGQMAVPDGVLLYFVKPEDQRDEFKDRHFAMRVSADMQSPLILLAFDWAEENLRTVQFEPSYDERVGSIASVTTQIRDTPLPYRRHLAMSDDGIAWRFVHQLLDQGRKA